MSTRSGQKQQKKSSRKAAEHNGGSSAPTPVSPIYPTLPEESPTVAPALPTMQAESPVTPPPVPLEASQPQHLAHVVTPSSSPANLGFHVVTSPPRVGRDLVRRGRNIKPERVPETSLVGSVAGFVYDSIPQSSSPQALNERIEWVNFQKIENAIDSEKTLDIIVLGLTRGFQIWALFENGECEEIVTERQGPLRIGRVLTSCPVPSFDVDEDRFSGVRPLFAVVDANSPVERLSCTLSFLSLSNGQYVHRIVFPDQICAFEESSKILVVSFITRIVVCDAMSLREQRCIYYPHGPVANHVFAVSDVFLAFADPTFLQGRQSCGGMMAEEAQPSSYTSTVASAASTFTKAISWWGGSMVSSFSSSPKSKQLISSLPNPGIVSVIETTKLPATGDYETESSDSVVAHFVAQSEAIGFLKFGHGGRLLLTSGQSSTSFNVFLLHPHPGSTSLGAAQHIYTLNRGTTPAKVVSCAFSLDNRYVAVATNHGTTHLFAICPYGGEVSMRTHGDKVVNKDSRYHRSAGLDTLDVVQITKPVDYRNYQFGAPQIYKDHPYLAKPFVARSARNPRIGPYTNPLGLNASGKLRDSLSVDNLSAWASDIAGPLTTGRKRTTSGSKSSEPNRLSVTFSSNSAYSEKPILLVANMDGLVYEYMVDVLPKEIPSAPELDVVALSRSPSNWQVPIKCSLRASVFWQLQRGPTIDMRLPISEHNPFLAWLRAPTAVKRKESWEESKEAWMSQIEVFTYSEPYRRLWNMPQFQFKTFHSDGHASADLVAPSRKNRQKKNVKAVPVVIEAAGSLSRSYDVCESASGGSGEDTYDTMVETLKDAVKDIDDSKNVSPKSFEFLSFESPDSSSSSDKRSGFSTDRDSLNLPFGAPDP